LNCRIDLSKQTTLFVGANNSGKTSAIEALGKFLAGRPFVFNDITIANRLIINEIGLEWANHESQIPKDLVNWESVLPSIDIWLEVLNNEIHYVANIIPTLKWRGGKLGVRLAFLPSKLTKLFSDYRELYFAARATESTNPAKTTESTESIESTEPYPNTEIKLYPKDLCDFLERKLSTYFTIKSYILDPGLSDADPPQATSFDMECFTDNPLSEIIKVNMIDAQRGFTDPGSTGDGEGTRKQLSIQLRNYYDRHLDPEKNPTLEDLKMLEAMETARKEFEKHLTIMFAPSFRELESIGYPGVTDPKIIITPKVMPSDALKHDSALQYTLSEYDETLRLPENFNGLGYQNLISIIFSLMAFRDEWMREGKAKQAQKDTGVVIQPLHLVLIEEPESHLHMQVQQVFIRKAYFFLRHHKLLKDNTSFSTQLVISTHSSHIARESNFADLRYFKRLPESAECRVPTAKVINLSDVFGKGDITDKFVTRYLQTTHCDLFFADAAILVEGSAESMLLPHFIRTKYPLLFQRYISILSINGRHSHRLATLIGKLCLPTLIITDLDSAEKSGHHKSTLPVRGKNLISGNYAIVEWLIKENDLDKLLDIPPKKKEFSFNTPYNYSIRIAYQTPVTVNYINQSEEALSSTFEDCLVYTNYDLFKNIKIDDSDSLVKQIHEATNKNTSFDDFHKTIYEIFKEGKPYLKAEFALDIIYDIDPKDITIPLYIREGLEWLQSLLCPKDERNE
jgi:predicted ATP-dependent endonuclease of OLD family